jgi:hypothetical protein
VAFTTDLAANHPGYGAETIGEFNPNSGQVRVYAQPAEAMAVTPSGDIFTALGGAGFGLARLSAAEHASAIAQNRAPVFLQHILPFDIGDTSMTSDVHGRIWVPVANKPQIALFDPATGQAQIYQYAAPVIPSGPSLNAPYGYQSSSASASTAVAVVPIVSMTTDSQGHLWYVRAGYNAVEEVGA